MTENVQKVLDFSAFVLVPMTCPACGCTEQIVQLKDKVETDPRKADYLCPHCGWPETLDGKIEVYKPEAKKE
jgi:transposase-like protein